MNADATCQVPETLCIKAPRAKGKNKQKTISVREGYIPVHEEKWNNLAQAMLKLLCSC